MPRVNQLLLALTAYLRHKDNVAVNQIGNLLLNTRGIMTFSAFT
jgi:hypothetical protein